MKPGFEIVKLAKKEVPEAMALLEQWNMAPRPASAEIPNPERESLIIEHTFVAKDNGKIIGVGSYLVLDNQTAETASLAVDPDYKGKGIGYALQIARLREIKKRGFRWVHSETDRPETINWYIKKFGYKKTGTNPKKHVFSLPNVDFWTVLKLDLEEFGFPDSSF